jgi:cytochrome P450
VNITEGHAPNRLLDHLLGTPGPTDLTGPVTTEGVIPLGTDAGMPRVATQGTRLSGVLVKAGESVCAARPAANRDEAAFHDGETLDVSREYKVPDLACGYGIHYVNAHLARMKLHVAIGSLIRRFPGLRFAVPEPKLGEKTGRMVRGLRELPICWGDD